jgi:N-dimethylarginine dimethylaminohydrolase
MKFTHHSEYLPLESLLIKRVAQAWKSQDFIDDQWQKLNYLNVPDFMGSINEYDNFENLLRTRVPEVISFPEASSVTMDSIYCRDASIATDFGMIICQMGKEARKPEPSAQATFYEKAGLPILGRIESPGTLEGGDVAWLDTQTLAVGRTYRTNDEGIAQLKALLEPRGVEVLVAELPHYKGAEDVFHLMSILSPVDRDLAVVYSPLMPISFREELINRGFKLIEVPEEEFETMGCNVLAVAPRVCVMVEGNPIVSQRMIDAGCQVHLYQGENISIPGGGGPTCLTRPLKRRC